MDSALQKRLPRVAIVGRPNVGKSTLANRMCGSRVSIVEPTAGVTRDRVAIPARLACEGGVRWVEVVDTGGIGIVDRDDLGPQVEEQIRLALLSADVVLWLVDVRDGITPLDQEVAKRLRGMQLPVLMVVNKVEGLKLEWDIDAFRALGGFDGPYPISAQNGGGLEELYERVLTLLPPPTGELDESGYEGPPATPVMKLAVIGQRNAGKSTLINALAREERMIVSEVPGTTRDAVDVIFERDGQTFVAIDTAGVRKKKSQQDAIDFYSDARSHKSIRRADVVVLLFDVSKKLSGVDKDLARYVIDHHKAVVLGANKWDLAEGFNPEDFREYIEATLPQLAYAPIAFLSAKEKHGVDDLLALALDLFEQSQVRVTTGELNRVLERALEARPPTAGGHSARIFYATQTGIAPPTVVIFVNDKKHFGKDFLRYLGNQLREALPFKEVPVRLVLRDRMDPEREVEENA
ncbi:MAG: ribosome biogenesis GTPase Der [Planctomycetes bacterium]|nr:ribosome biogenesis GTPase Der [Planctomycetota bacterium]